MKKEIKQAVILAGGRGERLRPFTDTLPKPMYPIGEVPFIVRLIEQIRSFKIKRVVILLGYLADKVVEELGDGEKYGVHITYDITPVEFDTGSRIKHAKKLLDDKFLLMYCDNYCPIDFDKLVSDSVKNDADIQMSVYLNKDNYTKSNIIVDDKTELVKVYDKKRVTPNLQGVEIGYLIVKKNVINLLGKEDCNFAATIFPILVKKKKLFATVTEHRYYSIGSYERINLTEEFFKPKHVVFLDRDGTLNVKAEKAHYIERKEDFKWLPGSKEAIKLLNDNNVITILVSNQPGIARGNFTEESLKEIHDKMQADLKEIGAHIDYIYYCPHNWFDGCECRKPKPGMLYQAARDLSLDLTKCYLFGDDERDIEAADAARCKSSFITDKNPLIKAVKKYIEKEL